MGFKLKTVEISPLKANEELDLFLELEKEARAAIHGVVKLPGGAPAKHAIVKLFKKKKGCEPCEMIPIGFQFTDDCGQFLFGVPSGMEFVIKVFLLKPEHKICESKDGKDCKDDWDW